MMILKVDSDPIKNIRNRIVDLEREWMRVDNVVTMIDDDGSYSRSYEEKIKTKKAIQNLINQNSFALDILITVTELKK